MVVFRSARTSSWCAVAPMRWSPAKSHQRKSPSGRPEMWRWCGACVERWSPAPVQFLLLALVMLRWSQAQADKRTRPNLMRFSKRPHFTYDSYIYISLILGCSQEFQISYFSLRIFFQEKNYQELTFKHSNHIHVHQRSSKHFLA